MAPTESRWHWESGDPVAAARFGLLTGLFMGGGAALLSIYVLILLNALGISTAVGLSVWSFLWVSYPVLLVEIFAVWYVPRRYAIVGRLGVSPLGIRLVLPVKARTFGWGDVRGVGPYWIDVFDVVLTQRFRLTPNQAGCVAGYLGRSLHP